MIKLETRIRQLEDGCYYQLANHWSRLTKEWLVEQAANDERREQRKGIIEKNSSQCNLALELMRWCNYLRGHEPFTGL